VGVVFVFCSVALVLVFILVLGFFVPFGLFIGMYVLYLSVEFFVSKIFFWLLLKKKRSLFQDNYPMCLYCGICQL
jgi:hypothetical protein